MRTALDTSMPRIRLATILSGATATAACAAMAAAALSAPGANPPLTPEAGMFDGPPSYRVTSAADLADKLASDFRGQLIVPSGAEWSMVRPCGSDLDGCRACGADEFGNCPLTFLPIHSGVSLVGERDALGRRPTLVTSFTGASYPLFQVYANDVRVEGLHFRGPSRSTSGDQEKIGGIQVIEDPVKELGRRVVVADNEFDGWTDFGVEVCGNYGQPQHPALPPSCGDLRPHHPEAHLPHLTKEDAGLVRVERNYIHHDARDGAGYGVVVGGGAYATIEANVFDFNRHDITSDGLAFNGYVARFNYALQGGFTYGDNGYWGQHFDVHGTGTTESRAEGHYDGGLAGEFFEVAFNTFRGEQRYGGFGPFGRLTRPAFKLRGRAAGDARSQFVGNVLVHDGWPDGVRLERGDDGSLNERVPSTFNLHIGPNRFDTDHSTELASGDFDGDGRTDVFVANGTAWFYSRAGIEPWEFMRPSSKRVGELAFADIDNDRVTDVLYRDPAGNLGYVKSGRTAPLTPLTTSPVPIGDLRFGDFDADGLTDIFYTLRGEWHVWYGRTRAWTHVGGSAQPLSELLFGDFDAMPGTDVATPLRREWAFSSGATMPWARLGPKRLNSFATAVAADFDGNGRDDIAFGQPLRVAGRSQPAQAETWSVSRDAAEPFAVVHIGSPDHPYPPLKDLLIGRFDGGRRAAVVTFDVTADRKGVPVVGERLVIWDGLGSALRTRSRENMR